MADFLSKGWFSQSVWSWRHFLRENIVLCNWNVRVCLNKSRLMHIPAATYRVRESKDISRISALKEVIKTDRTSTSSTFVAEKINVPRCYRFPMGTGSLHFSFLSLFISSNEGDLTIYISSNEWDLKGGTTVHVISVRTRCFHYCRKSRSPSHNFFVLKHETLQFLGFISVS